MHNQQKPQIQIPACQLALTGLKAEFHFHKHMAKLNNPRYRFDAGFDLYPTVGPYQSEQHEGLAVIMVTTMLNVFIPPGAYGWITDRSSSTRSLQGGWILDGKIDATYTGELIVRVGCKPDLLTKITDVLEDLAESGTAIAQLIIQPCLLIQPVPVHEMPKIQGMGRGEAGFGSTNIGG